MKSLVAWLGTRSPERLAALMTARAETLYGPPPRSLADLADRLLTPWAVTAGLASLTTADHQVLTAVARLAIEAQPDPRDGWPAHNRCAGTVSVENVLLAIGAQADPIRAAGLLVIDRLQDEVLVWPNASGELVVPGPLLDRFGKRQVTQARPLDRGLTVAYLKEPVAMIAETLGVGRADWTRPALQEAIVAHLLDPEQVRALLGTAPPGAAELLDALLRHGGPLGTRVFPTPGGAGAKYSINVHYADPDSVWLATHGLIVPSEPDRAEVPVEIAQALGGPRFPFAPGPRPVATVPVDVERVAGEAQQALGTALATMIHLLDALDRQPVTPRKDGGFPVRETRRLAKHLRVSEPEAAFWINLAQSADLISDLAEGAWYGVCPTTDSDDWRDLALAQRLAKLLRTWLRMDQIATSWPAGETPIAYGWARDAGAVHLRRLALAALGALPPGQGAEAPESLVGVVAWTCPASIGRRPDLAADVSHTLREAELLGVVAHGALSAVGQALISGDQCALTAALVDLLPPERTTVRFQADMTAIVTGSPSAPLAALLDSVADRESEGHALVYRLSSSSIRRALDVGADATGLLAQLTEVAEGDLPQPLRYLVAEVGRAHGRMRVVRSGCCIRSDDPSLVAELARAKGLAKLGLRRIAPTVVISAKSPTETLAALRAAGYTPALEAETGATVVERAQGRRAKPAVRYAPPTYTIKQPLALARKILGTPVETVWSAPTLE